MRRSLVLAVLLVAAAFGPSSAYASDASVAAAPSAIAAVRTQAPSTAATNPWQLAPVGPFLSAPRPTGASLSLCPCPGGTPENEADCGLAGDPPVDATNGGCNSSPEVFGSISCGETVCGTVGTKYSKVNTSDYRDTDWYLLELAAPAEVQVLITGEVDMLAGILHDGIGGPPACPFPDSSWLFFPTTCLEADDVRQLEKGSYMVVALPSTFAGIACGTGYSLTVVCDLIFAHDFESGDVCPWSGTSGDVPTCLS